MQACNICHAEVEARRGGSELCEACAGLEHFQRLLLESLGDLYRGLHDHLAQQDDCRVILEQVEALNRRTAKLDDLTHLLQRVKTTFEEHDFVKRLDRLERVARLLVDCVEQELDDAVHLPLTKADRQAIEEVVPF